VKIKSIWILFIIAIFLIQGCAEFIDLQEAKHKIKEEQKLANQRRNEYVNNHPELDSEMKLAILNGKVFLGMTSEQISASWGKPKTINRSVYTWGIQEQWVYGNPIYKSQYLYLENDTLTSFQDSK